MMNKGPKLGIVLVALALAACQKTKESPSKANPHAKPRDAAASDLGATNPATFAQGMMGQGMGGQGMTGPGMMRSQAVPEPGATGNSIFRSQCSQCHTLGPGPSGLPGPSLYHLFGRKAGTAPGYPYSTAMRDSGVVWNDATLDRYIAAPKTYIPGNSMPFPGISAKTARQRLVAYLKAASR